MITKEWLKLVKRQSPTKDWCDLYRLRLVRHVEIEMDRNERDTKSEDLMKRVLVEHMLHDAYGEARELLWGLRDECLMAARGPGKFESINDGFEKLHALLSRIDLDPKDLEVVPALEPINS